MRLRYVVVGALVVALAWMGVSRLFSLYARFFSHNITSYKTIGAFILLMIWLDLSGMLVMFGATVNATLQDAIEGQIKERKYFWQVFAGRGNK